MAGDSTSVVDDTGTEIKTTDATIYLEYPRNCNTSIPNNANNADKVNDNAGTPASTKLTPPINIGSAAGGSRLDVPIGNKGVTGRHKRHKPQKRKKWIKYLKN